MNTIYERGASPFIPGFELRDVVLENGIMLRVAIGGSGAPLVMLHGHPQNHVTWRKVAPELAKYYTVILPDLRGYGDSSKPASDETHRPYSKRVMANDIVMLMNALQIQTFSFIGHDRGGGWGTGLLLIIPTGLQAVLSLISPPLPPCMHGPIKLLPLVISGGFFDPAGAIAGKNDCA